MRPLYQFYKAETTKPIYTGGDPLQLLPPVQTPMNEDFRGMDENHTPLVFQSQVITIVNSSMNSRHTAIQQKEGKQEALAAVKEINGKSITPLKFIVIKRDADATAAPPQGVISDSDNRSLWLELCHAQKNRLAMNEYKGHLVPQIDAASDTIPIYTVHAMLTRGTTVFTDDLSLDYQGIPELDPHNRAQSNKY